VHEKVDQEGGRALNFNLRGGKALAGTVSIDMRL